MLSNVDERNSKRCKKKLQTVADFRNKISFLKPKNLDDQKMLIKGSNKFVENSRCDIINKSVKGVDSTSNNQSTSGLGHYNNKSVRSSINEEKFELEISRNSANFEIIKPSLTGSTMLIGNFNRKSPRKIYRRKLSHYKALIRILINARAKDLSENIMRDAVRCLKKDDGREFPSSILSIEFTNKETNAIESDGENCILSSKIREIDVQIPGPKYAARKSIECSKTGAKIIEKDFIRDCSSRSKNVENFDNGFENIDDKSTDQEQNFEKNCDSDATIPRTLEINENLKSKDKNEDKKVVETWLQKCIDPFEFDDSDLVSNSHQENVKDTKISKTEKKTERVIGSVKKNQYIKCIELEDNPATVNENGTASFTIDESNKQSLKKTVQRSSSRKNVVENIAVYIPDSAKGGETSRVFLKSGAESKKDQRAEKISKKNSEESLTNEACRNSKQPDLILKSKPTGNYCSCKRIKYKDVKTSAYAVPAKIEYPSLNIREGYGNRSTAVKSDHDIFGKKKIISGMDEKKTKKFYSPLELEYSDTMQLKLDPNRIFKNRNSKLIDNNSSKVTDSSMKKDKVAVGKSAERVTKRSKKFSISNFTLSDNSCPNNDETETTCCSNNSKSSKIPTFSKYSIPVSIEINMTKDNLRKRFLSMNLIQSKITSYFPRYKVQNKNVPKENSNSNTGANNFDGNGNRIERKNMIVARQKSKSRSLPKIESDVLLKDSEKLMCLKKLSLRKPQLSISRKDYLYGVISDSELVETCNTSNPSITCRENISPIINCKKKSKQSPDIIFIEDSNGSIESVVPPSYSIFSDDDNDKSIIDIDKMLDTQEREDLLAPWESVKIFDKLNHWHDDTFEP